MRQLTDSEHSKARALRLQQQINNTNAILKNRRENQNKPNKALETPLIKFSKEDILKKQNKFSTLNAQMAVSNKLMKAGEDLEAGVIPQIADPRSTSEKLRDLQLQTQTCMSNCKLLLSDNEQANELFTYLMGDQNMLMFFNYSFPDIKSYFDKKKNTLARTAILYIQQLQYVHQRTGGVDNPVQQQDYAQGVNATMNAVFQTGLAGVQAARDMHNDNINNLNNAGAMIVNEMKNNIVPQINILQELRNEIVDMNTININNRQDLLDKLDALTAVVGQDHTPEMQQAFEQAYSNLHLPDKNDIDNVMALMHDSTLLIGDKIDGLGGILETVTAQNLENVLTAIRSGKGAKKAGKAVDKEERSSLDDFINKAFTPETFNDDIHRMDAFAMACNMSIDKNKPAKKLAGDIYKGVIKYFKIIRRHKLSGEAHYSDRDRTILEERFGDLGDPNSYHELAIFYYETQKLLEDLMADRGAATLDSMKAGTNEPAAATASTAMIDPNDIKQEGNGLRKKRKQNKKVVKKQKVKRNTRYIV